MASFVWTSHFWSRPPLPILPLSRHTHLCLPVPSLLLRTLALPPRIMSLIKTLPTPQGRTEGSTRGGWDKMLRQSRCLPLVSSFSHTYFSVGLNYSAFSVTHNHEVNHSGSRRVHLCQSVIKSLNPQDYLCCKYWRIIWPQCLPCFCCILSSSV